MEPQGLTVLPRHYVHPLGEVEHQNSTFKAIAIGAIHARRVPGQIESWPPLIVQNIMETASRFRKKIRKEARPRLGVLRADQTSKGGDIGRFNIFAMTLLFR